MTDRHRGTAGVHDPDFGLVPIHPHPGYRRSNRQTTIEDPARPHGLQDGLPLYITPRLDYPFTGIGWADLR